MTDLVDDSASAADPTSADEDEQEDGELRWYQESATDHPAATVLLVSLIVAFPLLVFGVGSRRWFYLDEWDFLATRSATNLGDLFRPHNENLSTIPVLVYRALFNVFHLNSYWPYVAVVVLAHLSVVALLWFIMRRCGVNQWVALLPALVLLTFGSGYEDIVWAFQMGYTGSLALGLVQLLLADHDGPIDRRDALAVAAGFAALLCSGIGVTTVVMVGVACLIRRGWRAAALQTVPLGLFYLVWTALAKPDGPANPFHRSGTYIAGQVFDWDLAEARHTFVDLGHYAVVGVLLGVLLVVGLWVAWKPLGLGVLRRRYATIIAMLVASVVFASISGIGRWFFGVDYSEEPRYVYLAAALVLPAMGVAADALIRRWRPMIPVVVVLFLIGIPGNIQAFDNMFPGSGYTAVGKQHLASIAQSPLAAQVDQNAVTEPLGYPGLTVGWIRDVVRRGWAPPATVPPVLAAQVPLELGIIQTHQRRPNGGACQPVPKSLKIKLPKGSVFWVNQPSLASNLFLPAFTVNLVAPNGAPTSLARGFDPASGNYFVVELPDATMRIKPRPKQLGTLALQYGNLVICHN